MNYILDEAVALRSWRLVPHAYYIKGLRHAVGLSKDEWELLTKCDGKTDIEDSETLKELSRKGLCKPATQGDELTPWQKARECDNRYFPSLYLTITGKCNFNCLHCFMAADNSPLMTEFSHEQCEEILDQMEKCGIQNIHITGGEPMLSPNFMYVIRECAKRNISVMEIVTNGSFITEKILDEFIELGCFPLFKVSFDGIGHHDWMRGKAGTEPKTLAAIEMLMNKGFRVMVQMNLHRGNLETLMPTATMFDKMGIDSLRIIRTTEAPRWVKNGKDLCLGVEEYYDIALDFTEKYLETDPEMTIEIWQFSLFYPKRKTHHLRPVEGGKHTYRDTYPVCRGNRATVSVIANGDVVPCNQVSGRLAEDGISLGNVHKTPLQQILQKGDYLDNVTYTVGELQKENPKCQSCEYWKLCMGGCRACAYAFTDNIMGYDPIKCIYFFKGYMKKTLELMEKFGFECIDDI